MALLTKSSYLAGLQCPGLLWTKVNDKGKIPKPDKLALKKFEMGTFVGELATKVFPKGIDLANLDFKENIAQTKKSLKKKAPIFEAGFIVDGLYSRADILFPTGDNKWDILEIKSATGVKKISV